MISHGFSDFTSTYFTRRRYRTTNIDFHGRFLLPTANLGSRFQICAVTVPRRSALVVTKKRASSRGGIVATTCLENIKKFWCRILRRSRWPWLVLKFCLDFAFIQLIDYLDVSLFRKCQLAVSPEFLIISTNCCANISPQLG